MPNGLMMIGSSTDRPAGQPDLDSRMYCGIASVIPDEHPGQDHEEDQVRPRKLYFARAYPAIVDTRVDSTPPTPA
nr:hypothetical protein GCM10025699_77600 [Microbacterium flavescens]